MTELTMTFGVLRPSGKYNINFGVSHYYLYCFFHFVSCFSSVERDEVRNLFQQYNVVKDLFDTEADKECNEGYDAVLDQIEDSFTGKFRKIVNFMVVIMIYLFSAGR